VNTRAVTRALAVAAAASVVLAPMAAAHVTVNPNEAPQGGFAALAFRVPNERDDASTTSLEVNLPEDHPIPNVSVRPKVGWTYRVEMRKLDTPIKSEDGDEISEVPAKVTWTGGEIKPGEFDEFEISGGPLPDDTDMIEFPTLQTYSGGEVVRWMDPEVEGQDEPEHPAPALKLVPSNGDHDATAEDAEADNASAAAGGVTVANTASQDDVDSANTLATIGIVVGVLGLAMGGFALYRSRKSGGAGAG
jgi:uncharacterized protein YcnI